MNDYLVMRLLKYGTIICQNTFCLDGVEFRFAKHDSPNERNYLIESLESNGEHTNIELGARVVSIIFSVNNINEALRESQSVFDEALDIMSLETCGISSATLMNSGIIRNLTTGEIIAIKKNEKKPTNIFQVLNEFYPNITLKEYIVYNKNSHDLCGRLLNSLHWTRLALWENNLQIKILFNYFSIEALMKINDNDNVVPKAMLSMGFPLGKKQNEISQDLKTKLDIIPKYRYWRKILLNKLEAIRDFRNNSVHSGFRPWDIDENELKVFSFIAEIACLRSQQLIQLAIIEGCRTLQEISDYSDLILEKDKNLLNFVHSTLIHSLENKSYEWENKFYN